MAKPDATGGQPAQHPLVEALVPDPSQPPESSVALVGLRGRSASADTVRLYLTATLDEYVEVPDAEVIHTRELPDDGGTIVWVRSSVTVRHVRVESQQIQAEFLAGPITEGYVSAAGANWSRATGAADVHPPTASPRRRPGFTDLCRTSIGFGCPVGGGGYEPADVGGTISPTYYVRCERPPSDGCRSYYSDFRRCCSNPYV